MQNYGNWPFLRMNPNKMSPDMMNPNMMNPHKMSPDMMNPNMMNPNMMNPDKMSPDAMNPKMMDMKHQDSSQLSEALELVKQAVEGETEDKLFYDYLIKNASSKSDVEIISGIRDNEINHAKMFRQLYYEHTGKIIPPNINVSFEPPKTYCEGLKKALIGETNAVKKYRKILFAMKDRRHINMLTEIITDELRHGILYSFIIHSNECKY
jgi:rubrerythrin